MNGYIHILMRMVQSRKHGQIYVNGEEGFLSKKIEKEKEKKSVNNFAFSSSSSSPLGSSRFVGPHPYQASLAPKSL